MTHVNIKMKQRRSINSITNKANALMTMMNLTFKKTQELIWMWIPGLMNLAKMMALTQRIEIHTGI